MPKVTLSEEAKRGFDALPVKIRARVQDVFRRLEKWPEVSGAKPLSGNLSGLARIRTGDYRIIFKIPLPGEDITVTKIDDREDVYVKKSARSPVREKGADALTYAAVSIARDLRQARFDAGLTQAELASHMRLSQAMVSGVEAGRIRIGERYVNLVLKACKQPHDYPLHRNIRTTKRAASPRGRTA